MLAPSILFQGTLKNSSGKDSRSAHQGYAHDLLISYARPFDKHRVLIVLSLFAERRPAWLSLAVIREILCFCCALYSSRHAWLQAQDLTSPNTTTSFRSWHCEQIAADIKESLCRVSDTMFDAQANANIPTVDYEVNHLHSICKAVCPQKAWEGGGRGGGAESICRCDM